MRFAYADPPYLGSSRKHYSDHADADVYDTVDGHRTLIDCLVSDFADGWALSMAARNLHTLLPLCPAEARVCAWVKPYTTFFRNVNPAWAWEPVVVCGGRPRGSAKPTVRDWLRASSPAQHGRGFVGRKPVEFCYWLFELLGAEAHDELVDLFPGSGAVTRAWARWTTELPLPLDDYERPVLDLPPL
jgi:hypothetical protein